MAGDVRDWWRSQDTADVRVAPDEIRRRILEMETRARRSTYDLYAAVILTSMTIVALAASAPHWVQSAGGALLIAGLAFLAHEVHRSRRTAPSAQDGSAAALDYHRALLRHQLEFHRKRLWLRVLTLAPGGIVFFIGLALARPALAPIAWLQLATFAVAVMAIVPANRRAAARYEREIAALEELGNER